MSSQPPIVLERGAALPKLPWSLRLLARVLARAEYGQLDLRLPDGREVRVRGSHAGPQASLVLNHPRMIGRLLTGGDTGLLESFVDGDWDTADLTQFLLWGAANEPSFGQVSNGFALWRGLRTLYHWRHRNTRTGSRRNIAAHYDLGNAFYGEWLDPSLSYSSALFASDTDSLETAQRRKYQRLIDQLEISAAHHVLEIGSGWGGFAIQAARQTGCRVTSITLSQAQLVEARRRAWRAGVADRVTFELMDYRDVSETYDRIVSIEMFEAVGEQYWPTYFQQVHDRLKPGGRAGIQVITIEEQRFEDYRRNADFIQRYIFPGGMLPSPERFLEGAETAGLEARDVFTFGADYARTLAHWDQAVREKADSLAAMGYDARFQRLWHAYLCYCQVGFETGRIDVMQTVLTRR
ncbi:MAG: cyclopropane-fatty-acyl-phospholipid synthase family protein [Pseudomonadota bacterium]